MELRLTHMLHLFNVFRENRDSDNCAKVLEEECCVVDINDYSKYTWIYPLKKRSNVFQVFHNFQALVERKFDSKIPSMQSNWVVSMRN